MSNGEIEETGIVKCCVMNCQLEISIDEAITIENNHFCRICGVAFYRSYLNF